MRARTVFALVVTGLSFPACDGGSEAPDEGGEEGVGAPDGGALGGAEVGRLHVDYPAVGTDAVAGQFVLTPSRDALDRALDDGDGTFMFYAAELVEPGPVESNVRSLAGDAFAIPNALIVPIDRGYAAAVGDVLLGHWESGSGLRRAIVTGGTPTAPIVRYLDRAYDQETAGAQKEDTFVADRYAPLTTPWQIGTTVACGDGDDRDHGVLVHVAGDRILVSGFASKLEAMDKRACVSLPPRPTFAEGDRVFVPVVGAYNRGTVTKVEPEIGRVWVTYTWGGAEKVEAFPIVDVTTSFDDGERDRGAREGRAEPGRRDGRREGGKPATRQRSGS